MHAMLCNGAAPGQQVLAGSGFRELSFRDDHLAGFAERSRGAEMAD
jgi:hypothetical protein